MYGATLVIPTSMNYNINYLNYNSPLNEKVIEFQELLK